MSPFTVFSKLRLRTKMLVAFFLIITFTVFSVGAVNVIVSYNLNKALITTNAVASGRKIGTNLDSSIKAAENTLFLRVQTSNFLRALTALKVAEALGFREKQRMNTELSMLLHSSEDYRYVVLGDYHGALYFMSKDKSDDGLTGRDLSDMADRLWALKGACQWSLGDAGTLELRRSLISSETIEPLGFIVLGIDKAYFSDIFANEPSDPLRNLAVFNESRQLVLGNGNEAVLAHALDAFLADGAKSEAVALRHENNRYLVTGLKTSKYNWFVISAIDTGLITRELAPLLRTIGLVCIPLLVLSLLLSILVSRTLMQNVRVLKANMDYIVQGDFSHKVVPTTEDELGVLATRFDFMRRRIVELNSILAQEQETRRKQEILALEARYHSLQVQHNPHFLYNVLDSISSVSLLRGQTDISRIACKLAELLRESLSDTRQVVSLRESLDYCMNYTSLYELLYHENVGFTYDIDPELLECEVPSFVVQPLVENAVRHGLERKAGPGHVLIRAFACDGCLVISVVDNGAGFAQPPEEVLNGAGEDDMHLHIGLKNLLERIHLLYGPEYGISITSEPNRGTCVDVKLPLRPVKAP